MNFNFFQLYPFKSSNYLGITLVLILAIALRIWDIHNLPFTHDEFSALFRTQFDSFNELIEKGVKVDGHPALVQVFLFYWVKLFGFSEVWIKLPFIFSGVASVWLTYLIGKNTFGHISGLLASAFLASSQFSIFYSQLARPYSIGLLFVLMAAFLLTRIIQTKKLSPKQGIGIALSFALAAYTHHFSMLTAFLLAISGLFLVDKSIRIKYIAYLVASAVLYFPHLPILFAQLNIGGVEAWLAKPSLSFFSNFLSYIMHFSWWVAFVVFILLVIQIFLSKKQDDAQKRVTILFAIAGVMPMFVGYLYSVLVSSVLQFSVLLFSFPFLLLLLFSHMVSYKSWQNGLMVFSVLLVNTFTLIVDRKHYRLLYESIYEQSVKKLAQHNDPATTLLVLDAHPKISPYYFNKYKLKSPLIRLDSIENEKELLSLLLKDELPPTLMLGVMNYTPPNFLSVLMQFYPKLLEAAHYVNGSVYTLVKSDSLNGNALQFDYTMDVFGIDKNKLMQDNDGIYYKVATEEEWPPALKIPLPEQAKTRNILRITSEIKTRQNLENTLLIAEIKHNDSTLLWKATHATLYLADSLEQTKTRTLHLAFEVPELPVKNDSLHLQIYFWNKSLHDFEIKNYRIMVIPKNPVLYAWYEKIMH